MKGARLPKAIVAAVSVVLLIEAGLHLLAARLPEPVTWGAGESSVKVAQVTRLAQASWGAVDILIAGPSHASIGLSPMAMQSVGGAKELKIYNGGLNGRSYSVVNFVSEQVYEPLLRPKIVVLTASPVILNGNNVWMERNTSEFFAAPMPKALRGRGLGRVWRRFLSEDVYLFKYRRRGWGLSDGYLDGKKVVDEFGYHSVEGEYGEESRRELLTGPHPYRQIMNKFSFSGPSVEGFTAMVKRLQDHSCEVIVVNMPFRSALLEISEGGEEDYRDYLKAMKGLQAGLGFTWLDYQETLPLEDSNFKDVDHLNISGAKTVSVRLASDLLRLFPDLEGS